MRSLTIEDRLATVAVVVGVATEGFGDDVVIEIVFVAVLDDEIAGIVLSFSIDVPDISEDNRLLVAEVGEICGLSSSSLLLDFKMKEVEVSVIIED